jgi:hypothetical protein
MNTFAVIFLLACGLSSQAIAAPIAVDIRDKGRPTLCAEEDNVYATMSEASVRRFEVVARQPVYGPGLKTDIQKPDFAHCAISAAHDFLFTPRTVTLYEDAKVMVRGVTYPRYWRPETVAVEVAGRGDSGFHLLQLFVKRGGEAQEVMVLHVADGYWRLRPLPLPQFKAAVYGTSFLIGPIEDSSRPFVRISKVTIDPATMTFRVAFAAGGEATVVLARVDRRAAHLTVALSDKAASGPMFAAIRSMYVQSDKADAARVTWRDQAGPWLSAPVIGFEPIRASAVAFDRTIPSRHNTAAPDMVFEGFDDGR